MELKKGYKQTEIGMIPGDWVLTSFGETFDFLSSASYSRAELCSFGHALYVHYGDIHTKWSTFVNFDETELPAIRKDQLLGYSILREGDLIVADASEDYEGIGKSVEVKNIGKRIVISGLHTFLLRSKSGNIVNGFKGYIHANKAVKKQFDRLATGLKVYGITRTNLKKVLIPLPSSISEQIAIANALSDTDAWIQSLTKLIAKKCKIKQGAMQTLLTPYKNGSLRAGWIVKKLGDIAEIRDGTHQTPMYVDSGIPFYSVESVTRNDFKNTKFISEVDHKILTRTFGMEKGDILMTRIGSIGDCKLIDWDVDASFYVSLALIKLKKSVYPKYFLHFSKTHFFQTELENNSLQFAIPKKINLSQLANVLFAMPFDIKQQILIGDSFSEMDNEIAVLETKLEKAQKIKQAMMQNLLTGKIRLI